MEIGKPEEVVEVETPSVPYEGEEVTPEKVEEPEKVEVDG
jgi:hypothetical protein